LSLCQAPPSSSHSLLSDYPPIVMPPPRRLFGSASPPQLAALWSEPGQVIAKRAPTRRPACASAALPGVAVWQLASPVRKCGLRPAESGCGAGFTELVRRVDWGKASRQPGSLGPGTRTPGVVSMPVPAGRPPRQGVCCYAAGGDQHRRCYLQPPGDPEESRQPRRPPAVPPCWTLARPLSADWPPRREPPK